MDIYIDDDRVDETFASEGTVEDTLRHVQSSLCAPDQLVIGIRCDGKDVPPGGMAETLLESVSSFQRLDVFTGTKDALVTDAMDQASACLAETEEACGRAADLLTEGNIVEAAEVLGGCLRTWRQIHEAVGKSIEMLQLDPQTAAIDEEPLVDLIGKPTEVLMRVKVALQDRDHVLLADILQYEFSDVMTQWHQLLSRLRQEAENLAADRAGQELNLQPPD